MASPDAAPAPARAAASSPDAALTPAPAPAGRTGPTVSGEVWPSREEFLGRSADDAVVPVVRRLLADGMTPVGVYATLAGGPGSFLLESADGGVWSRYSFVGVRCDATLTEDGGRAVWLGTPPPGVPVDVADPIEAVRRTAAALHSRRLPGLPPLTGGLVGYVAYDAVRRLERLPAHAERDLVVPDVALMVATDLAVLDHADGTVLLVANAFPAAHPGGPQAAYAEAVTRLDAMTERLAGVSPAGGAATSGGAGPSGGAAVSVPAASVPATALDATAVARFDSRTPEGDFRLAVERAKEEIRAGECFQIVVSQRFATPTTASALDVYRVLRMSNPSPYMYLLRFTDGVDVVGSSPEALVKVSGGRAMMHPIAGTRWRGDTPEQDAALAAEMLADPKERSEHVMLVDLGRNDLGRVCVPGTVDVVDFMSVERYSHVMHIVSTVVGETAPAYGAVDVLTACFPAGTLSGAPKIRAMELIDELEPVRRGLYGGCVGYLDFAGDLDMAIAIRTALMRDGVAYVQAGAGIVADSDPDAEERESRHKARAVLSAIAVAETMRPVAR